MAQVATLKIFEALRKEFEEPKSVAIAEAIETALQSSEETLVTKADLKSEMAVLRTEMAQTESRITKWMFVLWAGHTITVVGIVIAVIKYLK